MASRNQARRLSADRAARRQARTAIDAQRLRWSNSFPLITEAALRNRNGSFVIDGRCVDGRSDFNGLHRHQHHHEVEFYAFDILISDGEPVSLRVANTIDPESAR